MTHSSMKANEYSRASTFTGDLLLGVAWDTEHRISTKITIPKEPDNVTRRVSANEYLCTPNSHPTSNVKP